MNSVLAALGAVAIALVLGTLAAMAVQRFSFFGRDSINFMLVLPIALPGVVTGIALSSTFQTFGVEFGLFTIIVGHATFCVVIAYNNVVARLRRLPRSPEEASADLGADTWITFRRITMPGMRTALLSGALLAFALSFDEVIVTLFTAGAGTQTIPIFVLAAMQRPAELPVVNVVALVLILASVIPVYLAQRLAGAEAANDRQMTSRDLPEPADAPGLVRRRTSLDCHRGRRLRRRGRRAVRLVERAWRSVRSAPACLHQAADVRCRLDHLPGRARCGPGGARSRDRDSCCRRGLRTPPRWAAPVAPAWRAIGLRASATRDPWRWRAVAALRMLPVPGPR